jgi:branched-chain amino acid transport system permease protein
MEYLVFSLSLLIVYVGLTQLLHVQFGLLGIPNFGVVGFWGSGLYLTGILTVQAGLPLIVAIVLATLATGALAWVLGRLILRRSGQAILCATLAFSSAIGYLVISEKWITNGVQGLGTIRFPFAGVPHAGLVFGLVSALVVAGLVWGSIRLRQSRFGRVMVAIRDNEELAASLGKDTGRIKLAVFTATCALMGFLGGLSAPINQFLVPSLLVPSVTFTTWIALVLGGKGHGFGPLVGVALTVGLFDILIGTFAPLPPDHAAVIAKSKMLCYGLLLVAVIMFRPQGVLGLSGPGRRPAAPHGRRQESRP